MTANKFKWKVGDRVAVYNDAARETGKIRQIFKASIDVTLGSGCFGNYHPKQLRRLKPRPKEPAGAREFWILDGPEKGTYPTCYRSEPIWGGKTDPTVVHVIEKLPNTVTVSREDLAKAWDIQGNTPHEISILFEGVCKALGLKEKA